MSDRDDIPFSSFAERFPAAAAAVQEGRPSSASSLANIQVDTPLPPQPGNSQALTNIQADGPVSGNELGDLSNQSANLPSTPSEPWRTNPNLSFAGDSLSEPNTSALSAPGIAGRAASEAGQSATAGVTAEATAEQTVDQTSIDARNADLGNDPEPVPEAAPEPAPELTQPVAGEER